MEYFVNYSPSSYDNPGKWAAAKEAEGWHGVCASDHFWVGDTLYPHVFVAATEMACATERTQITTSFCNNLFRSPVEFAQAALSLQAAASGRFEAGLGAGWLEDEILAAGESYPDGPTRVSMYVEALQIVRELLATQQCKFAGEHYRIDVTGPRRLAAAWDTPPPLIAAAGGPRSIRETAPLVDRLEIKASARATRPGSLDFSIMATVTEEELAANAARARAANPGVPLGVFILVAAGDSPAVQGLKASLGNGFLSRFMGAPADVASALERLSEHGINRVQLTELAPESHSRLAEVLL